MDSIGSILQLKLFPFPGSKTVEPRGIRGICPLLIKSEGHMTLNMPTGGGGRKVFRGDRKKIHNQKWNLPLMKKILDTHLVQAFNFV